MHESAAMNELGVGQNRGDVQFALVEAVLALAPAVNRLAEAHESLTEAVGDLTPPQRRKVRGLNRPGFRGGFRCWLQLPARIYRTVDRS